MSTRKLPALLFAVIVVAALGLLRSVPADAHRGAHPTALTVAEHDTVAVDHVRVLLAAPALPRADAPEAELRNGDSGCPGGGALGCCCKLTAGVFSSGVQLATRSASYLVIPAARSRAPHSPAPDRAIATALVVVAVHGSRAPPAHA